MPRSSASPLARPSPTTAAASPRHAQPASPSRQSRSRGPAGAGTPGIITLPQPKGHQHNSGASSSSRSASPARAPSNRHSSEPPRGVPTGQDKPADSAPAISKANQVKRRNREKRSDSPLKQATAAGAAAGENDTASTGAESADSPSKPARRRRGGRASRQPSPPMPPTADAGLPAPPVPLPGHSRSLPTLDSHTTYHPADEWDMPVSAAISARHSEADKPKESLSWQQELLRSGSIGSHTSGASRHGNNASPLPRPRSRGQATSVVAKESGRKTRPALTTSHSDTYTGTTSTVAPSSASASLNWQQELLLRTDDVQLVQQVSVIAGQNATPARQRRNQAKDSVTFGLANLDLTEPVGDVFSTLPVPAPTRRQQPKRASHGAQLAVEQPMATPLKPAEPRYAGPTFHNSPAPSALPVPSFMLRRQAEAVVSN